MKKKNTATMFDLQNNILLFFNFGSNLKFIISFTKFTMITVYFKF